MSQLIIALDHPSQREALSLVDLLDDRVTTYKVGLELYTREGPGVVRALRGRQKQVFLDLKVLDIPNTVARTVEAARELGAGLLTVHAQGGSAMLEAAVAAAGPDLKILAVTVLTSLDREPLAEIWDRPVTSVRDEVLRLARFGRDAGVQGVVASPLEAADLRKALGSEALVVTPGIRLAQGDQHDQVRVATPEAAVRNGASHLVVGRAVTEDPAPAEAVERVLASMDAGRGAP